MVQNLESPGLSGRVDSPVIFAPQGTGGEGKVHTQLTAQQESIKCHIKYKISRQLPREE